MTYNSFFDNISLYYINLENRKDRNDYMINHLESVGCKNYQRVNAFSPKMLDEKILKDGKDLGTTIYETASTFSHIYTIKKYAESSDAPYAIITEDDVDFDNTKKITFKASDLFKKIDVGAECFQLVVSTREDVNTNFKLHSRLDWDFNCTAYLITKDFAKKVASKYFVEEKYVIKNFTSKNIFEYRNKTYVRSKPVPEYAIYTNGNTLSLPIFGYQLFNSSINWTDENYRQNTKSRDAFLKYWSSFESIDLFNIFGKKSA